MTLPIARELARFGVRVVTIAPGVFETAMMAGMTPAAQEALAAAVPFPPRLGRASEFADLAEHIMTNSMLNGTTIRLDGALRLVLVTPDMHRVHHSEVREETDSDFGFCLSCWDRLFGTYRAEPAAGQLGMVIGVVEFRADQEQRLVRVLAQPFREAA